MSERSLKIRVARGRVVSLLIVVALAAVAPASGQEYECIVGLDNTLFDTSSNCASQPSIDRVFGSDIFRWGSHDYLVTNVGNELRMWRLDNPQAPVLVDGSNFNVGNMGDSDYDLLNFSVCDDCRWGVANYKLGTVLFDLGGGSVPNFIAREIYNQANIVPGAFTFSHDGVQYLIASTLANECASGDSTLYTIDGINDGTDLDFVGCVDADTVITTKVVGGYHVGNHLYLGDLTTRVFIFEIQDWGATINLAYVSTPMVAYMIKDQGLAVDEVAGVAVEANSSGMTVWDISNPGSPVVRATVAGSYNRASVAYPFALVARKGFKLSEETWDLSSITNPQPLHESFWDATNPFNHASHQCAEIQGATFSPDGSTLYLSRYSMLQMADMAACEPTAPVAALAMSPVPAFPGDTVNITDASYGRIDRWALWVTDGPDPADTLLAGTDILDDSNPTELDFQIGGAVTATQVFWAHVVVESDIFPYVPEVTLDQIDSGEINIDRAPDADISYLPVLPVTGDSLELTALAEGHPAHPGGGETFQWVVSPPASAAFGDTGQSITVDLDQSGTWEFDLVVFYEHGEVGGGSYLATKQLLLEVSTVAAHFSFSPENPAIDDHLVLDAGSSRLAAGATPSYQWLVSGATTWSGCSDAVVCTIPPYTLNPGLHEFRLTLTNTANGDQSIKIKNVHVLPEVNLGFTFSPDPPEIGQMVLFEITGVAAENLESATWDFGEEGCTGFPQVHMCSSPPATDCLATGHRYANSGGKQVSLTAVVDGAGYGPVVNTVNVLTTGFCPGSCNYTINPTTANYGPAGGSGVVNLSTSAGCPWTATTTTTWITITAIDDGSGPGTVSYDVAANPGAEREGTMTIGGRNFIVSQTSGLGSDVWELVASAGLGTSANQAVSAMAAFSGQLYLGTRNQTTGCQLWRSTNGVDWTQVVADGFGDANNTAVSSIGVLASTVYVGTRNPATGCELWSSTDGTAWSQSGSDGFGDADNLDAPAMAVLATELYVGTENQVDHAEVWRSADGMAWTLSNTPGFGTGDGTAVTAMVNFENELYASDNGVWGLRIWHSINGTWWTQVGVDGFGDNSNERAGAMADLASYLYLGTSNPDGGAEVWRSAGGITWLQSNENGFGAGSFNSAVTTMAAYDQELFAGVENSTTGTQVWRFAGSGSWEQSNIDGFGELGNTASPASTRFAGALFVGTENSAGFQLWRLTRGVIFVDSFETGDASAWSTAAP